MFLKKGSKLYSILKLKCPQCHEGDFFIQKSPFKIKQLTKTHKNCPNCNLKYMREPSFYFGAMYVAYGLSVAISILTFLITNLIFHTNLIESFITISIVLILSTTINLRLARIIWINIFVPYQQKEKDYL